MMGKPVSLLAIVGIAIVVVSFSIPGASAHPVGVVESAQTKPKQCSDLPTCKKCLWKGSGCAWSASQGCMDANDCGGEEDCFKAEDDSGDKTAALYACGASCAAYSTEGSGCDECVGAKGVDCAWYVDKAGGSAKCIGKKKCGDKGFETGSCIKGPKPNKKNKTKKKKTCATLNKNCSKKMSCAKCMNYGKKGANCAWWASKDGSKGMCIGADACTAKFGASDKGECTVKDAFSTKKSNKETCQKFTENDFLTPTLPPKDKCQVFSSCGECFEAEDCVWKQFGSFDKKCGANSGGCYSCKTGEKEDEEEEEEEEKCVSLFCPVLPECGQAFPELLGKHPKAAIEFFIETYGEGSLCTPIVKEGDFYTEDYRCDRVRLFVDAETQITIVAVPVVG